MKTKDLLKQGSLLLLILACVYLLLAIHPSIEIHHSDGSPINSPKFTYTIINVPGGMFGYDIYVDGRKKIHQPSIPALPGMKGFKNRSDAAKIAEFVMAKMKKGELPPVATIEEMKKINVFQ